MFDSVLAQAPAQINVVSALAAAAQLRKVEKIIFHVISRELHTEPPLDQD
jgi:hypothetical protein